MEVRWPGAPPIERLRAATGERVKDASVVVAHDVTGSNEVLISIPTSTNRDLNSLRDNLVQAMAAVDSRFSIRDFEAIGPQIGADLRRQALGALACCCISVGVSVFRTVWRRSWPWGTMPSSPSKGCQSDHFRVLKPCYFHTDLETNAESSGHAGTDLLGWTYGHRNEATL